MNPTGTWGEVIRPSDVFAHVMSPALIAELLTTIGQPRLQRRFAVLGQRDVIARALAIILRAETVVPKEVPRVCRDEDDDEFFACALAGGAEYIVSEDED